MKTAAAAPSARREARSDDSARMVPLPRALRAADEHKQSDAAGRGWKRRFWQVAAVIGPIATVLLYWYISQDAIAPRTFYDENHLLQMARRISGDDNVAQLAGSGYYPGWAVIMAPIWWFTHDAATVYTAAVTLSNALGVATILPLAMLGRHLGLSRPQAITLASVVMILPARSVLADYALSEQAIMFFYAWAVLGAFALWRRPTWWRTVLFVAAVFAAYSMHPRALALMLTSAIWLLAFALRRWRLSLLGLALLAVSYRGVDLMVQAFTEPVLISGFGKEDELANTLANFDANIFGKIFLNQTWVQVVGTAGLFAVGSVLVVVWTLRELHSRRLGTGALLFGLVLSTMLVSAVYWTNPGVLLRDENVRLDAWTYSRYIDPVSAIVVFVALAALIQGVRSGVVWLAAATFVVGSIPVVFWVARYVPMWGQTSASNSAILPWVRILPDEPYELPLVPSFTNEGRFWIWASIFALACLVAMVLLSKRPRALAAGALALVSGLALLANPSAPRLYPEDITAAVEQIESRVLGQDQARIDIDRACRGPGIANTVNWLPFWLSPRVVEIVDRRAGEQFDSELVVSCADWPQAEEFGARAYVADADYGYRLWVLPGELQDQLAADGLLE